MPDNKSATTPLNLNEATLEDLIKLPGVGSHRAMAILDFRERQGGFKSVEDLWKVRPLGRSVVERLLPLVAVASPPGEKKEEERRVRRPEKGEEMKIQVIGMVNVNEATADEIALLPGVGRSKAEAIIEYRKKHGPFTRKKQLLEVPGIGPNLLRDMEPYIRLKGKTTVKLVGIRTMPPDEVKNLLKDLERRRLELKKIEHRLREAEKGKLRSEILTLINDLISEVRAKTDVITEYITRTTRGSVPEEIERLKRELDGKEKKLKEKEALLEKKKKDLEALKEDLLRKEVEIIIDEAKFEEIRRKERELASREDDLKAREVELETRYQALEKTYREREGRLKNLMEKEKELRDREEALAIREEELAREEQQFRDNLMRREVELIAREVEIEDLRKRADELEALEEELRRKEEELKRLRAEGRAVSDHELRQREEDLKRREEEFRKKEEDLKKMEVDLKRKEVELTIKETKMSELEEKEREINARLKDLEEREARFLAEAEALLQEAKRIKERLEEKKIEVMAREAIIREITGESMGSYK